MIPTRWGRGQEDGGAQRPLDLETLGALESFQGQQHWSGLGRVGGRF